MQQSPIFAARTNIALHVVYRDTFPYPVNLLRNVALRNAPTDWVFSLDIDFAPPPGLELRLDGSVAAIMASQKVAMS